MDGMAYVPYARKLCCIYGKSGPGTCRRDEPGSERADESACSTAAEMGRTVSPTDFRFVEIYELGRKSAVLSVLLLENRDFMQQTNASDAENARGFVR